MICLDLIMALRVLEYSEWRLAMKCANCGNKDSNSLFDEGDTFLCTKCYHRTRKDNGEDDVVLCPVCHHMRDRKALYCMWCGSAWGTGDSFDKECFDLANEFEEEIDSSYIRYYKLKGKHK